ncbi:MAG: tetratricopeptide repeat protein [Gemmatimonadota bacterium]|nr:tetratricopeptide repeat protein [Gemmatimonadota bacterium]
MKGAIREVARRRVPQVAGVYLAAGWAVLEFTDWAVEEFALRSDVLTFVLAGLLLLLPIVVLGAWRLGANGPDADLGPAGSDAGGAAGAVAANDAGARPSPVDRRSVAVLPFANVGGDPEDEFLGDGIADEILDALARIAGLRVVARTSALVWKGRSGDVREIGRSLGAGAILEGTIRRSGDRLRIRTRLVDVSNGLQLWSGRFDRELRDVFEVQDEIAANVAKALEVVLSRADLPSPPRSRPADVRAYEFVLRGRQFLRQTRRSSLEFAGEMFRKASDIDPDYVDAWVGATVAGALLYMFYPAAVEGRHAAEEASRRALDLAPGHPDAHMARGLACFVTGDFEGAEAAFREAMEGDPHQFEARYYFGRIRFQQGRFTEAAALLEEAARVREDHAAAFFGAQAREAAGDPDAARAGYARALAVVERHMELFPDDARAATMRAVASCRLGDLEEGIRWAEAAVAIDPADASVRYNVACLFALEGETERALDSLEEAFACGFGNVEWIRRDPDLTPLRDHPRFQALIDGEAAGG